MQIQGLVELRVEPVLVGVRPGKSQAGFGRFLHDLTQLPGQCEFTFTGYSNRFHKEDISAVLGPGQTHGYPHLVLIPLFLLSELGNSHVFRDALSGYRKIVFLARGQSVGQFAADSRQTPFQVSETRLPGVFGDNPLNCLILEENTGIFQAIFLNLFGDEVAPGDLHLFVFGVPRQPQDLHPVLERRWNGGEHIGGTDKHDVGEIERYPEIVVHEVRVLLGIEHLHQGGGRIAPIIGPDLVYLVKHEYRVVGTAVPDSLDNAPRERADIGPAVAADLRLVADTSQRHSDELAVHGLGD